MKYNSDENYPAPACARGLWVLKCLSISTEPMSLEQLYQKAGIPKATLSRILDTLLLMELVTKNKDKTYQTTVSIQSVSNKVIAFEDLLFDEMTILSKQQGFTAEWYEPAENGMVLKHSISPVLERKVWAREGFVRTWQGEIDAVYRVGRAFFEEPAPENEIPWSYGKAGAKVALDWDKVKHEIEDLKLNFGHSDVYFNENGVRRAAIAIHYRGEFQGVLATAECWTPSTEMDVNCQLPLLEKARESFIRLAG